MYSASLELFFDCFCASSYIITTEQTNNEKVVSGHSGETLSQQDYDICIVMASMWYLAIKWQDDQKILGYVSYPLEA